MNKVLLMSVFCLLVFGTCIYAQPSVDCVEITDPSSQVIHAFPNHEVTFEAIPAVCNDPDDIATNTILWFSPAATIPRQEGISATFKYLEKGIWEVSAHCSQSCGDNRFVEVRSEDEYVNSFTNATPGVQNESQMYFVVGEEIIWDVYYGSPDGAQPPPENVHMTLSLNYESGEGAVSYLTPYTNEGDVYWVTPNIWVRRYHFYVDEPCEFTPSVVAYAHNTDNWPNGRQITVTSEKSFVFQYPEVRRISAEPFFVQSGGSLQDPETFTPVKGFLEKEKTWQVIYNYLYPGIINYPVFPMSECEYYEENPIYLRMEVVPHLLVESDDSLYSAKPYVACAHNRFEILPVPNITQDRDPQLPLYTTEYDPFICQSSDPLPDDFVFYTDNFWYYRIKRPDQEGYTNELGFEFVVSGSDPTLNNIYGDLISWIQSHILPAPQYINFRRRHNGREEIRNLEEFSEYLTEQLNLQGVDPSDDAADILEALYPIVQDNWFYSIDNNREYIEIREEIEDWITKIMQRPCARLSCGQLARIYILMAYTLGIYDVYEVNPVTTALTDSLYLNCVFLAGSQYFDDDNRIEGFPYQPDDLDRKMICNNPTFMAPNPYSSLPVVDVDEFRTNFDRYGHQVMGRTNGMIYDATFQYHDPVIEGHILTPPEDLWVYNFNVGNIHNTIKNSTDYLDKIFDITIDGDTLGIRMETDRTLDNSRNWILGD